MHRLAITLALALLTFGRPIVADDTPTWTIPTCTIGKVKGKRLGPWRLRYVVPKDATVKKAKDIDYREYRVFRKVQERWEFLSLFSGNGSPDGLCSAAPHRRLRLPDGTKGSDARCISSTKGGDRESRSAGFMGEYAYYYSASAESTKYFDAIIDSMCYEPPEN